MFNCYQCKRGLLHRPSYTDSNKNRICGYCNRKNNNWQYVRKTKTTTSKPQQERVIIVDVPIYAQRKKFDAVQNEMCDKTPIQELEEIRNSQQQSVIQRIIQASGIIDLYTILFEIHE